MRLGLALLFMLAAAAGSATLEKAFVFIDDFKLTEVQYGAVSLPVKESSILWAGDMMLARDIELIMASSGPQFPFTEITSFVRSHDLAIANFEGSVPAKHKQTPPLALKFSVPRTALSEVARAGFDVLSLSNNHALDYGEAGLLHTRTSCEEAGLTCVGHPTDHGEYASYIHDLGNTKVGILMLHTLFEPISTSTVAQLIDELEQRSDVQFVFIHWGDEYERIHNASQEKLAHFFIDQGIDAVIGHHPHVMQDIERYNGRPIFYSLGNLIFDQYFSKDVQEGYFVRTLFEKDTIRYELVPYDMHDARAQPKLQSGAALADTLRILLPNETFSQEEVASGSFSVKIDTRNESLAVFP